MAIILFIIYLLPLYFMYAAAIGLSGPSRIVETIMQEPVFDFLLLILLFGLFSTTMWYRKSKKQENYKIWIYLSVGPILLWLLIQIFSKYILRV